MTLLCQKSTRETRRPVAASLEWVTRPSKKTTRSLTSILVPIISAAPPDVKSPKTRRALRPLLPESQCGRASVSTLTCMLVTGMSAKAVLTESPAFKAARSRRMHLVVRLRSTKGPSLPQEAPAQNPKGGRPPTPLTKVRFCTVQVSQGMSAKAAESSRMT